MNGSKMQFLDAKFAKSLLVTDVEDKLEMLVTVLIILSSKF